MSEQQSSMQLSSPAFDDGERIPQKYGRDGQDVNPLLRIDDVPEGAQSLALLVEDPDAQAVAGTVWTHWLVYDISPDRREIPEDWDPEAVSQGRTDFDETAYGGPSPPSGEHTYVFRAYALEEQPDPFDPPTAEAFQRAIRGSVMTEAELRGTYPADW
jgi:Raf kinase inhibitor-like YbhB/YbcL family protein